MSHVLGITSCMVRTALSTAWAVKRDMYQSGSTRCRVQARTNTFVVSEREFWPTHRRIVGNVWGAGWNLEKAMFAVTSDGEDKRVPNKVCTVLCSMFILSAWSSSGSGGSSSGSISGWLAVATTAVVAAAVAVVAAAGQWWIWT